MSALSKKLFGGRWISTVATMPWWVTSIPVYCFAILVSSVELISSWRSREPSAGGGEGAAGDHHAVHLRRAFINAHDADLLRHELQRQLLGDAHGAEGLHRVVDHLGRHLRAPDLDHGCLRPDVPAEIGSAHR